MSIMVGGFGLVGSPLTMIEQLINRDVKELTIFSNNIGESGKGLGQNYYNKGKLKKQLAHTSQVIEML